MGNNKSKEVLIPDPPKVLPGLPPPKLSQVASNTVSEAEPEENPMLGKRQRMIENEIPVSRKEHMSVLTQMRTLEDLVRKLSRRIDTLEERDKIHTIKEKETSEHLAKMVLKEDLSKISICTQDLGLGSAHQAPTQSARELRPIDANTPKQTHSFEVPTSRPSPGGLSVPNKTGAAHPAEVCNPLDLINQIKNQLRMSKPAPEALEETRLLYKKMKLDRQSKQGEGTLFSSPFSLERLNQQHEPSKQELASRANPEAEARKS
jgi:hypothetical protein